jgi:hypothetical protein
MCVTKDCKANLLKTPCAFINVVTRSRLSGKKYDNATIYSKFNFPA